MMPIQIWSERIWVVQLADEPVLSEELTATRQRVESASTPAHIVVDMAQVERLNSSNLSQLLQLRKMQITRDVKLRLAAPTDSVWAVFLTTGLEKVFEFAPDVTTALAGLQLDQP